MSDEKIEGVFNYGAITDEHKAVIKEVLNLLKQRENVPLNIIEKEIKQKFQIEDLPEMKYEDSLWYQLTKDVQKKYSMNIQGHKLKRLDNGKQVKIPYIVFTSDIEQLDELANHFINKAKSINVPTSD